MAVLKYTRSLKFEDMLRLYRGATFEKGFGFGIGTSTEIAMSTGLR
jgi:hypothetical protein